MTQMKYEKDVLPLNVAFLNDDHTASYRGVCCMPIKRL